MEAAFRLMPTLSRQSLTSASKSSGTALVLRSAPIWPETYKVPSIRIPGLNGRLADPGWSNSGGAMTFFSAQEKHGPRTMREAKRRWIFRITFYSNGHGLPMQEEFDGTRMPPPRE